MPAPVVEQLPRNMTDETLVLARLPGARRVVNHRVADDLAAMRLESALPIRRFYSWKGKRNYEGRWWSSTTRTQIEFESLLERDALMIADFDAEVVAISAQPFALLWPRTTKGSKYHVPDFFLRLASGDGRVVDVKHPGAVANSAKQFALTRDTCSEIGWEYEIFTGIDTPHRRNVRWLSGYRHDRFSPPDSVITHIVDVFGEPTPLGVGVSRAAKALGSTEPAALANIYHLMWRRLLHADLSVSLRMETEVSA
ncbi:TnsA-like heteromeric transposase endonuclease subunit [Mycobacterium noviomagense]|uniref:TnsA-like heteromeric transposase endonuclease subunit n=1 Tax=Mycobacterium noviomagense TaxID=459858 RepID=UPI001E2C6018|nr:TnsA-like heteromeric transposase endonuclease subunit [Mycobacterium noviomagense]